VPQTCPEKRGWDRENGITARKALAKVSKKKENRRRRDVETGKKKMKNSTPNKPPPQKPQRKPPPPPEKHHPPHKQERAIIHRGKLSISEKMKGSRKISEN